MPQKQESVSPITERVRKHRERQRELGMETVYVDLPAGLIQRIDIAVERQGLRGRSQLLTDLLGRCPELRLGEEDAITDDMGRELGPANR